MLIITAALNILDRIELGKPGVRYNYVQFKIVDLSKITVDNHDRVMYSTRSTTVWKIQSLRFIRNNRAPWGVARFASLKGSDLGRILDTGFRFKKPTDGVMWNIGKRLEHILHRSLDRMLRCTDKKKRLTRVIKPDVLGTIC